MEETQLLSPLIFFLLFIMKMPLGMAQDHQVWALEQQEQSQEIIKQYEQEALSLKKQSLPIKERVSIKGCSAHQNLSCSQKQVLQPTQKPYDSSFYIFVSFSMPKETLKSLAIEAKRHNAFLVIRGIIENSFLKTSIFLKELGEGIVLDPLLFRDYNVVVVPTFIEAQPTGYRKISGNITLAYALEKFKEDGTE